MFGYRHKTIEKNVNSSWNFCAKSKEQFKALYEYQSITKELQQDLPFSINQLLFNLVDNEIENLETGLITFAADLFKPKIKRFMDLLKKIENKQIFPNFKINYKVKFF